VLRALTDARSADSGADATPACHNHAVSTTEIAGYRVIRQLGAGGMGQVFLVQHPRLPRQDALKLLDSGVSRNDDFKARFQREADLLAQLSHQNIVTLYDRGEFEGRLWITMEYVDGTDASELLKADGPLDSELALSLVAAAGAALDYAWRKQRITHRDVKPANILVGIDETHGASQIESVKLADFGIAKAAGESTSLTSTGMTIGTMQYISPEAIEGEVVDNRSDIYSLGCTAFHLLTGQPPFTGTTIASTMSAHLTKPVPSISAVNEHLPERTDAVLERVLAKNPDDRYQSCAEFVTALQEAVGGGEVRYPASAPTLAAATSPKRGAVDPDAPTQLRKSEAAAAPPQRKSRAVPILASAVGVLAVAAVVLGVYANRGGSGVTSTTETQTTAASTLSPLSTTSGVPPLPSPPVVTTTVAMSAPPAPTAVTGTLASGIVPGLVFPSGTVRACDEFSTSGPTYGVPPPGQCWEPGTEHWRMQSDFGHASEWMAAQMSQKGLEAYSTYGDGPSSSWGLGTKFRVTVEMDQNSSYETDVYVVDVNSVKGAR
jgi:serine/threonine-protein kinase